MILSKVYLVSATVFMALVARPDTINATLVIDDTQSTAKSSAVPGGCQYCSEEFDSGDGVWYVEYGDACDAGDREPDCSWCNAPEPGYCLGGAHYYPSCESCGLEESATQVFAALDHNNLPALARLLKTSSGVALDKNRMAIQLISRCGSTVGNFPLGEPEFEKVQSLLYDSGAK